MTDPAARLLAEAYAAHGPACRLYARALADDPEDVVQETFVRLARRLTAGQALPEHLRAWLLTAVRSAAIDARRRSQRRRNHESTAFTPRPMFEPGSGLDAAAAERALEELAPRQRETVILRLWGDLGFEAIAQMTGVATSTAHADFTAGIADLRRRMGIKDQP